MSQQGAIPSHFSTLPYQTLEFLDGELGMTVEELQALAWVRKGVAKVERRKFGFRIEIGPYVGRLVVPDMCVIDIEELVPGTIDAMIGLTGAGQRLADAFIESGPVRLEPSASIAMRFAEALNKYVAAGIQRTYLPARIDSGHPRGTVNVARTVSRLWVRGQLNRLSSDIRLLTEDTPQNRFIKRAVIPAEALIPAESPTSALLRRATAAFSGVTLVGAPEIKPVPLSEGAPEGQVLYLASLLIEGVPALPDRDSTAAQDISVWFNAAIIFEAGIRALLESIVPPGAARNGKGDGVTLFVQAGPSDEDVPLGDADPDVVVTLDGSVAILDAKYRSGGAQVGRDEIYQLMAHAVAYEAAAGALVVPRLRPSDQSYHLGTDARGCRYSVVVVDANNPARARVELERWLESVGHLGDRMTTRTALSK